MLPNKLSDSKSISTTTTTNISMNSNNNGNSSSNDGDNDNSYDLRMRVTFEVMLTRLQVEKDRRRLFSSIYEGPISNRGKVRLNWT